MWVNCLYVFCLTVWAALAFTKQDHLGLSGLILGVTLGLHLERFLRHRREIRSLSGMTVKIHYHDASGACQELTRDSPSSFGGWTPAEKIRWIKRAERDLQQQAERDSQRGAT